MLSILGCAKPTKPPLRGDGTGNDTSKRQIFCFLFIRSLIVKQVTKKIQIERKRQFLWVERWPKRCQYAAEHSDARRHNAKCLVCVKQLIVQRLTCELLHYHGHLPFIQIRREIARQRSQRTERDHNFWPPFRNQPKEKRKNNYNNSDQVKFCSECCTGSESTAALRVNLSLASAH